VFRDLTTTLVLTQAQLKARYRNTVAGIVWVILNPVIMFGAQAIAFKHILKITIEDYYLYLLAGLVPWIFVIMTIQMATPILAGSGPILKAFKLNPIILIFSQVLDNLLNFMLAFSIMFIPIQMMYGPPAWTIILCILPLFLMLIGISSLCTSLSLTQVFYRDTNYVVNFITGVMFFVHLYSSHQKWSRQNMLGYLTFTSPIFTSMRFELVSIILIGTILFWPSVSAF